MLLPGNVNAHSHAFQRAIRGWTQWKPYGEDADFWSWREAMYRAVLEITPEELYDISLFCFIEMACAGYTTVGEFHYVQRAPDGSAYADSTELAQQVIRAANDAGLRIALLNVCYARGDVGMLLRTEQRRFNTPVLDAFIADLEALRGRANDTVSVGVAPHSVRAVPREWLRPIGEYAAAHDLPVHMHVSEQPAEVQSSVAAYGLRPGQLVAAEGLLSDRFVGVHGTHLTIDEIRQFGEAQAFVCACPTTERDLGDGILAARELLDAGGRICIGSDSQTVIDPWEEIRSIEYHTRLERLRRVVLAEARGDRLEITAPLLAMGATNGADALGVKAGAVTPGHLADLVAIDLDHIALAGWTPDTLAALIALSGSASMVSDVWVHAKRIVEQGRHPLTHTARRNFEAACKRVLA